MIKVLDYGSGNVKAITNIYKRLNIPCAVASNAQELRTAEKIIVPGVGAFDHTIDLLERSGMLDGLNVMVLERQTPVLGVCVGMQVMAESSEEGARQGLGWIPGVVRQFNVDRLPEYPKLPHMGWNSVCPKSEHPILQGVDVETGFYFLHSYTFACNMPDNILATSHYGGEFTCAIAAGHIFGFQFHPEKSHANGIRVFRNFAEM